MNLTLISYGTLRAWNNIDWTISRCKPSLVRRHVYKNPTLSSTANSSCKILSIPVILNRKFFHLIGNSSHLRDQNLASKNESYSSLSQASSITRTALLASSPSLRAARYPIAALHLSPDAPLSALRARAYTLYARDRNRKYPPLAASPEITRIVKVARAESPLARPLRARVSLSLDLLCSREYQNSVSFCARAVCMCASLGGGGV